MTTSPFTTPYVDNTHPTTPIVRVFNRGGGPHLLSPDGITCHLDQSYERRYYAFIIESIKWATTHGYAFERLSTPAFSLEYPPHYKGWNHLAIPTYQGGYGEPIVEESEPYHLYYYGSALKPIIVEMYHHEKDGYIVDRYTERTPVKELGVETFGPYQNEEEARNAMFRCIDEHSVRRYL